MIQTWVSIHYFPKIPVVEKQVALATGPTRDFPFVPPTNLPLPRLPWHYPMRHGDDDAFSFACVVLVTVKRCDEWPVPVNANEICDEEMACTMIDQSLLLFASHHSGNSVLLLAVVVVVVVTR